MMWLRDAKCLAAGLTVLCLLLHAAPARGDEQAAAEALFLAGQELFDAGEIDEACAKLEASLALDRAVGTLVNLARCHAAQGRTATAWAEYREVADRAAQLGQDDRARGAADMAAQLEPQLSRLTIIVRDAPAGLAVEHNGSVLSAGALGAAVPVDPGNHRVVARAPGRPLWSTEVAVKPGAQIEVSVPSLAKRADGEAVPPAPRPADDNESEAVDDGLMFAGLVVGSAGVVALGVGTAFGVITLEDVSAAEDDPRLCPGRLCSPEGREQIDAARTKGIVSTVLLGVGGAALAAGAIMTIVGLTSDGGEPSAFAVELDAGPDGGWFGLTTEC
jgi:hypothetical protein